MNLCTLQIASPVRLCLILFHPVCLTLLSDSMMRIFAEQMAHYAHDASSLLHGTGVFQWLTVNIYPHHLFPSARKGRVSKVKVFASRNDLMRNMWSTPLSPVASLIPRIQWTQQILALCILMKSYRTTGEELFNSVLSVSSEFAVLNIIFRWNQDNPWL